MAWEEISSESFVQGLSQCYMAHSSDGEKALDDLWNWWLKRGSQVGEDAEVRNAREELEPNNLR